MQDPPGAREAHALGAPSSAVLAEGGGGGAEGEGGREGIEQGGEQGEGRPEGAPMDVDYAAAADLLGWA